VNALQSSWLALLLSFGSADWTTPTPGDLAGKATYYAPGLMRKVTENRDLNVEGFGAVALNRAGDLGRVMWLDWGEGLEGPYLSVDCAQGAHYRDRIAAGRVIEVSAQEAKQKGCYGVGPVPVKVLFRLPVEELIR